MPARRAFTLIELLVVLAVMGVLAGMIMGAANIVRARAAALRTVERMEQVLSAIQTVGGTRDRAQFIQERLPLPGVSSFAFTNGSQIPTVGTGAWIDASLPHLFATPWNQPGRLAAVDPQSSGGLSTATLADLDAGLTVEWLGLCGILPADPAIHAATWRDDRGPGRAWNDSWGRPLVVAYGLFQPLSGEDVVKAKAQYQNTRIIYLSVGAPGRELTVPDLSDPAVGARALWPLIVDACKLTERPTRPTWDAADWSSPPWKGVRTSTGSVRAFLSAPLEIR